MTLPQRNRFTVVVCMGLIGFGFSTSLALANHGDEEEITSHAISMQDEVTETSPATTLTNHSDHTALQLQIIEVLQKLIALLMEQKSLLRVDSVHNENHMQEPLHADVE